MRSRIQNPEFRSQNEKSRSQEPGARSQNESAASRFDRFSFLLNSGFWILNSAFIVVFALSSIIAQAQNTTASPTPVPQRPSTQTAGQPPRQAVFDISEAVV